MRYYNHRWLLPCLLVLPTAAAWSDMELPGAPHQSPVAGKTGAKAPDVTRISGGRVPTSPAHTAAPAPVLSASEGGTAPAPSLPPRDSGSGPETLTSAPAKSHGAAGVAAEPGAPQQDPEERIKTLEEQVRQLLERIQQLEKSQPAPAAPHAPEEPAPAPAPGPAPGSATQLPNISAVGNFKFAASDSKGTEGRGKFSLEEFEIAVQDRVAPNMRLDAIIAAEKEEGWEAGLEEGYLTWTNPLGLRSLSAQIGRQRTRFGKLNPLHPHQWPYVTQPPVITAMLGHHGLNSDGILAQYLVPVGGSFLNLELGRWETASEAEDGLGFAGGENGAYSGRLWFGKEVGRNRELEVGVSHYTGHGDVEGLDRQRLAVTGLDFTYRSYPGAYQRLMLQGELLQHSTGGFSRRRRHGGYLTLAKRWNRYFEGGLRGDYTRYPYPVAGHESAASLFLTRFLTEQTALRLELRHGSRPEDGTYNEAWLQILTGFGPHSHVLQ